MTVNKMFKKLDKELYSIGVACIQPVTATLNEVMGFDEKIGTQDILHDSTLIRRFTRQNTPSIEGKDLAPADEEQEFVMTTKRGVKRNPDEKKIVEGYLAGQNKYTQRKWAKKYSIHERTLGRWLASYRSGTS